MIPASERAVRQRRVEIRKFGEGKTRNTKKYLTSKETEEKDKQAKLDEALRLTRKAQRQAIEAQK